MTDPTDLSQPNPHVVVTGMTTDRSSPPDAPQEVRGALGRYSPHNNSAPFIALVIRYDAQSRERIVEQMARAMCYAEFASLGWDSMCDDATKMNYRMLARAALSAIEPRENKL